MKAIGLLIDIHINAIPFERKYKKYVKHIPNKLFPYHFY